MTAVFLGYTPGNEGWESKGRSDMQVAIHAGALFTDEGRLIKALQANAALLGQRNVSFWGPRRYRQIFAPALNASQDARRDADALTRFLALPSRGAEAERSIVSDPSFIGEKLSVIEDGQLYRQAGQRVAHLDRLMGGRPVELFLGLRNLGTFLPKVLMWLPEADRLSVLNSTDLSCLSWLSMIEDIRELAPDVKVTLWSSEDSPLIWGEILRAVTGMPDDLPVAGEFDFVSSLVSDIGKHQIQKLVEQDGAQRGEGFYDDLVRIFQQHALPDEIEEDVNLPGWSDDIVAAFTELYEQDLTRIQSMSDIRFLKP